MENWYGLLKFSSRQVGTWARFGSKRETLEQNSTEPLKRAIGAGGVALSTVNLMVGTGIFVLPAMVANGLGATAMLAYFVCGILIFCLALCFAELSSKLNISGGPYTYIEKAFGPMAGFLASNVYVFGALASDAALASGLTDTLQVLIPQLRLDLTRMVFQFLVFAGLAWLNISSVKNGMCFVIIAGIGKLIPMILLVLIAVPQVEKANLQWIVVPTFDNIGSASLLLFFAFLGIETATCTGGETKNPARNLPLGLVIGITLVIVLYLSIQIVSQGILGDQLENTKTAPLAALADITLGRAGMIFMIIVTIISILGSLSGEILSVPRILFATARDGMLPALLAKVHPQHATPYVSIIVYAAIGFILSVSGGFRQLAIFASLSLIIIYFGIAAALLVLRRKQVVSEIKTFRVPGGPVIPIIAGAGCIWMISNSGRMEAIGLAIFIVFFSAIYLIMRMLKNNRQSQKL